MTEALLIHPDDILRSEQLRSRERRWRELKRSNPQRAQEIEAFRTQRKKDQLLAALVRQAPLQPPRINWRVGEADFLVRPGAWKSKYDQEWKKDDNPLRYAVQAATDRMQSTVSVVVRIAPGTYKGIQIRTPDQAGKLLPTWEYEGFLPRLVLLAEKANEVLIEGGFAWMSGVGEIWTIGIDCCTQDGSTSCLGSAGATGILRQKNCKSRPPIDPKQLEDYGGTGMKWWMRSYEMGYHTEDCDLRAPCQEHTDYGDNRWMTCHVRTKFGPAGRTHHQGGTRVETGEWYGVPSVWLGTLFRDCEGYGLHAGLGGGSGITVWGYPGIVCIDGWKMVSSSEHPLDGNRCFSIWEAYNYGGTINPDGDAYATNLVYTDRIRCEYPKMDRPLGEVESALEWRCGEVSGNCLKPWIDSPDQWPSGSVGSAYWLPGNYVKIPVKGSTVMQAA